MINNNKQTIYLLSALSFACLIITLFFWFFVGVSQKSLGWFVFFVSLFLTSLLLTILNILKKNNSNTIKNEKIIAFLVLVIIIGVSCFSMKLSPEHNGQISGHRNQYEIMANSLIDGHLYMNYDNIDPRLEQLDNVYDPLERGDKKINCLWDHAYYKGHYYMYFGVVPVVLLFVPFKLITGISLNTYHATQLFVALFIYGLFCFMFMCRKRFFSKLSFSVTLLLFSALSLISTWFIDSVPSLYCTAISSGMCMEIWSLFFFFKGVYVEKNENRQFIYFFIGSTLGALSFGCRPPIGLINFALIPLLIKYLKDKKKENLLKPKLIIKLLISVLPYFIIGALLMAYNYLRFENIFEFGQSYQLTYADQSRYGNLLANFDLKKIIVYLYNYFFLINTKWLGIAFQYLILWFCLAIFNKNVINFLKEKEIYHFVITVGILIFFIIIFQALTSPWFIERYKTDTLWILCLMSFFVISGLLNTLNNKKFNLTENTIKFLCVLAIITCIIFFFVPNKDDRNFTGHYYNQIIGFIKTYLK